MDGEGGWDLMPLDLEYTENGQYSVIPPSGFDGFSSVNVTVDVGCKECNLTSSTVTVTGSGEHKIDPPSGYDGFSEVIVNVDSGCEDRYDEGVEDQKAKLTSTTFTENGLYEREDGWNSVQVDVDTVTPYNNGKEDGAAEQKAKLTSLTVTNNGTYRREDGYNEVVVSVAGTGDYEQGRQDGIEEQKSKVTPINITDNGTYSNEDGYSPVVVNVDTVTPYNEGYEDGENDQKAKLSSIIITSNGIYTNENGYDRIVVNVECGPREIMLSVEDIEASPEGGDYPVAIYSSDDWHIVNHPDWVTIDNESGNSGLSTIIVTVDPSETPRSGVITVTNGSITKEIHINQRDIYGNYLTIEALQPGVLGFRASRQTSARAIEVSLNGGSTWRTVTSSEDSIGEIIGTKIADLQAGDKVLVRGINQKYAGPNVQFYNCFTSDDHLRFKVYGNIMSLINGNDYYGTTLTSSNTYAFAHLFWGCEGLVDASQLALPSNTIDGCYKDLFFNCVNLTEAPTLPATVMTPYCYDGMFNNTGLTKAPSLPSTQLADHCYSAMFSDCSRLTIVPELPATTLAPYCYYSMFDGNSLLTTAQSTLPATILAAHCYEAMFSNCSRLTSVPVLPATVLAENCYNLMFQGCIRLTKAPDLNAPNLVTGCYAQMFKNCTNLNSVKCLATAFNGTRCTYEWMQGVNANGTFTKANTNIWARTTSGIPINWTVVTI